MMLIEKLRSNETSKQGEEIPEGRMPVWFLRTDKYDVYPSSSSETSFFDSRVLLFYALNKYGSPRQQSEDSFYGILQRIRGEKPSIARPRQAVHPKVGIDKLFQDDDDREIDPEVLEVMKEDITRIGRRNPLLSAWARERASLSGGTPRRPMQVSGKAKKQYLHPIK